MALDISLAFLTKLEKNNNKPWFDKHRAEYLAAKEEFETFVADVHSALCQLEPKMADQSSKDCIFRIFRDVRFSKDKTPYNRTSALTTAGRAEKR